MRARIPAVLVSFLVLALGAPAAAQAADAAEVLDCVAANLPDRTSVQMVEFQSSDRGGGGRTILSKVSWKRFEDGLSKVVLQVHGPPDLRGAGLLLIEKKERADLFMYLPDLQKVRRVNSQMLSGSLFGSDFTYEDFTQLQGMSLGGHTERLEDASLEGVPVYVLVQHPGAEDGSAYERVVSYVERESCVPLKMEMWEKGDRLRKVLTAERDSVFDVDGVRIPRKLLMRDMRDESSTRLVITDIEIGTKIPRKLFTTSSLQRATIR